MSSILPTPPSTPLYSTLSFAHSQQQYTQQQQKPSQSSAQSFFHNPISHPSSNNHHDKPDTINDSYPSSLPINTISNNKKPNRHSLPKSNIIWQQHQQQMQFQPYQQQQHHLASPPSSPLFPLDRRAGLPRLSLDTSHERLQKEPTVIQHGDQSYLKLFSPTLVDSPVSFLDEKQLLADKKMWENGPDEAFQKQLEMERCEANKVRSRQQVRGFLLGLWLGFLMSLLVLQQTSARVFIPTYLARHDTSTLMLFTVLLSCVAVYRMGTRCIMTAIATCIAVLTCFATIIVNQIRYTPQVIVYRSGGGDFSSS